LHTSTKAKRTLEYYGGLDNFLRKAPQKLIEDSKMTVLLKKLIKDDSFNNMSKELKDLQLNKLEIKSFSRETMNFNQSRKKKKQYNLPSVYYPVEYLRTDISKYVYPNSKFITRVEQTEINNIKKELEFVSNPEKRKELNERLFELTKPLRENNVKDMLLKIQPKRHKEIRDEFMKLRKDVHFPTKLKYIESLKVSENLAKVILGDMYKHYSEDYPEIQILLQDTEKMKIKKRESSPNFLKTYSQVFGEANLEKEINEFDATTGKLGREARVEERFLKKRKANPVKAKAIVEKEEEKRLIKKKNKRKMIKERKEKKNEIKKNES